MNHTVIYARADKLNETELNWQVQVLQGLAANLRLNVTHTICETASSLDFDRPGLQKLMRLSEHHEIDTVIMTNLDRISLDELKVLDVLEELDKHGVKLIIQGSDTVEAEDNPLIKFLRRFTPHSTLEVVLASTTE